MGGKHYLPLTDQDRSEMLAEIGVSSVEELFNDIPARVRLKGPLDLPPPLAEMEALKHLGSLAAKNISLEENTCFLGAGVYDHFIPSVIKHITGRSEFFTSYTPYQPEISQGMLQAIFEYQTMLCMLTGMDAANASMYDGGTAVAEAAIAGCGATRRSRVLVSRSVSPFYRAVLKNYFNSRGLQLDEVAIKNGSTDWNCLKELLNDQVAAVIVQQPNFFGLIEEMEGVAGPVHENGALLVVAADPSSLPLLRAPSEYGADIVAGEAQGFGVQPSLGGPMLGYIATRQKYVRQMPGRIVGETVDQDGNRGFALTLQTREQHIRREKAASNICTNEALLALAASVYMAALGPDGLKEVAGQCLQKAAYARQRISALPGYEEPFGGYYFKEFVITVPGDPAELSRKLLEHNIFAGFDLSVYYPELKNAVLFAVTEKRTRAEIDSLVDALEGWK